jgi:hypothetical protein
MLSKLRGPHLGMILPAAVVVLLAGSVVVAGAASANRISPRQPNGPQGIVASVNGSSDAGTCGTADASGTFTMTAGRRSIVTVDVATTTTFTDAALTPPTASFANLCVGSRVKALGTLSSGTLAATAVTIAPARAQGVVASLTVGTTVTATDGTCGGSGSPQSFTLASRHAVVTVDIGSGTTFSDAALTPPTSATFGNLCVGGEATALGTESSGGFTATAVTIVPAQAQGVVSSVTVGTAVTTTDGICGSSGAPQSFTLARRHATVTVDIGSGTSFSDAALTPPTSATFGNLCVGEEVTALGTESSGVLGATLVTIVPAQAQGVVSSVTVGTTGSTTTVTCGTSGEPGSFTLGNFGPIPVLSTSLRFLKTVDVSSGTSFSDAALTPPSASFADVCVGSQVKALGTLSAGVLTATAVTIEPAQAQGVVTSVTVNGGTTSTINGSCGTSDAPGSFTLGNFAPVPVLATALRALTTVDVTTSTTFSDAALTPPTASFLNVCVGGQVKALGTLSSGALVATAVTIEPAIHLSPGHGNLRGHAKS